MTQHFHGDKHLRFSSPADLLGKAKRDLIALNAKLSADTVFNFFVTAWHVADYVLAFNQQLGPRLEALRQESDFRVCKTICNSGKHLELAQRHSDVSVDSMSGALGGAPLGAMPLGGGIEWYLVCDNQILDPTVLAGRIVVRWETFFADNGIPT